MTTTEIPPHATATCTAWCVAKHESDPACWGEDIHRVGLTVEDWTSAEDNSITPYAYRETPAHREVVKLHLYRPSDRELMHLDDTLDLTAAEARELATNLVAVADLIAGAK